MTVSLLDHVTLRTSDLEGTRAFLEILLDLTPGYRPDFPFPGYWLYAGDEPVVHLIPGGGGPVDRSGETIDHIGFRLTDYDGILRKVGKLAIPHSLMNLPEIRERRIFVETPTGILLELVFRNADATSSNSA